MTKVFLSDHVHMSLRHNSWQCDDHTTWLPRMVQLTARWIGFFALFSISTPLLGGEVSLLSDTNEVEVGEAFTVVIRIEGKADREPSMPEVKDMEVLGRSTSSQTSIVNGSISSSVEYSFEVVFNQAGVFEIPGIELKVDGRAAKSNSLKISVGQGQGKGQASSSSQQISDSKSSFLEVTLSHQDAFVGEVMIVSTKLYSKESFLALDPKITDSPKFRRIPVTTKLEQKKEILDGVPYFVIEFSYLLVPKTKGDHDIPIPQFDATVEDVRPRTQTRQRNRGGFFDDFFGQDMFSGRRGVKKRIIGAPHKVKIKELPKPIPKNFSGVVGQFTAQALANKSRGKVGDSFDLKIKIEGQGDLEGVTSLSTNWDSAFQVYDSKPKIVQNAGETTGLVADGTFEYALIPKKPGSYKLILPTLNIFNPELGQYVSIAAEDLEIVVEGDAASAASTQPAAGDNDTAADADQELNLPSSESQRMKTSPSVKTGFSPVFTSLTTLDFSERYLKWSWSASALIHLMLLGLVIPWKRLQQLKRRRSKGEYSVREAVSNTRSLKELRNILEKSTKSGNFPDSTLFEMRNLLRELDEMVYSQTSHDRDESLAKMCSKAQDILSRSGFEE